ncbi:MAG: RluA family pseudouridine synthase [Gemmatimonadaceae bacterium]
MSERATGTRHVFEVEANSDVRLDTLVADRAALSRTQAATLIANGHVTVDGRREKASYKSAAGERIEVFVPPASPRDIVGESIPLSVAFEDDDLIVIDKPAGMVVHPAPGNWSGTLVNALIGRGGELSSQGGKERPGLIHRLDKDTSGLVLVAKNDRAHRILSAAMAARRVVRRYAVLSWGHLEVDERVVERPIARDPSDRQRMAIVPDGKPARTSFRRLARFDAGDLLRAHLHTGRTHQIRVHLASIGHPVVGDDTYGGGGGRKLVGLAPKRHFLHAAWLRFVHPTSGVDIDLRSPLPADLRAALARVADDATLADTVDPLAAFAFYDVQET